MESAQSPIVNLIRKDAAKTAPGINSNVLIRERCGQVTHVKHLWL